MDRAESQQPYPPSSLQLVVLYQPQTLPYLPSPHLLSNGDSELPEIHSLYIEAPPIPTPMDTRVTTPPVLLGPSAKERKYDRQLRLWASHGQEALERANVLLLNSGPGAVGVEVLKNLILPGVGHFTIVDGEEVTESDLGVNFFLTEDSLGKSRAEEACKLLQELNPEVEIHAVIKSIEDFVGKEDALHPYSLVLLIGPMRDFSVPKTLSEYALAKGIPLFYIFSVGFYSQFSVQLPSQFPVVDTHPDPVSTEDLRLLKPWPELMDFMRMYTDSLESLDDHAHGHVSYLLLLLHYLEKWKASHDGKAPAGYAAKKEFKTMVEEASRKDNAEGGEENFDEAAAAVLKSLNEPSIPSGIREVFAVEECQNPKADSPNFWLIANAIYRFHFTHDELPLPGALPDMKAISADYIGLQNIYKSKARLDLATVTSTVRYTEDQLSRDSRTDRAEIEAFCKNAAFVKLINGGPIRFVKPLISSHDQSEAPKPDFSPWNDRARHIFQELENEESSLPIYIAFLAYDWSVQQAYTQPVQQGPTQTSSSQPPSSSTATALTLSTYTAAFLTHLQSQLAPPITTPIPDHITDRMTAVISELVRANGAQLHNISALTGGMVAQEAIKVLTKQYVPVDNVCVFDGVGSKTGVFKI